MKRFGVFILSFLFLFFLFPIIAFAQCPEGFENLCRMGPDENPALFGSIVQFLIIVAIVVAIIFVILGGIKWITSGGDKGKVEGARGTIIGAVVGLIIAMLSYAIVGYVVCLFTGKQGFSLEIPTLIDQPTGAAGGIGCQRSPDTGNNP